MKENIFKKSWCFAIILILILSGFIINVASNTDIIDPRSPNYSIITLNPTDDTFIKNNNYNYGSYTNLRVRNNYGAGGSSGWYWNTLINFDISSIPTGSNIISASLKLYYYDTWDGNPTGRALTINRVTTQWYENIVTGKNQPLNNSEPTSYSTVPASFGWMTWNVKNDVQDFVNEQATNYGWKIADDNYWGNYNIPVVVFYSKEYGSYTPVLQIKYSTTLSYYSDDFSTDPNLQGSNYNDYAKVNWDSPNKCINWVGRRETEQIDRYFTFSGISMSQPNFCCDFWADSIIIAGQNWGLINHFLLKKSDGKYIGFEHTMDSDLVGFGNRGIRGEFYNGATTYYTPWIFVEDEMMYIINVFIENGVGKIKINTTIRCVTLSGDFSGGYNSFHFKVGGTPSADDHNGAIGWFDNLRVDKPDYFVIPKWGGAMIHSDTHLSDSINLPPPTNNIEIIWTKNDYLSEQAGCIGNGIAGNKKIAAAPFGSLTGQNNLIIYDYNGNRLWKSGSLLGPTTESSTPMVDKYNRVIICDSQSVIMVDPDFNADGEFVWETPIPGIVLSPTRTDNGMLILPLSGGSLYSYNIMDGSFRDSISFGSYTIKNSACINGNRVYLLTSNDIDFVSRFYAVDVDSNGNLEVAWYYQFDGKSQASPTFIDRTLYFDVYQFLGLNPQVYALTDYGTYYDLKWTKNVTHRTMFSMSYDPRGGIWYEDYYGPENLYRFDTDDGGLKDTISVDTLINDGRDYIPMSVMEICGDAENPIMIVSANYYNQLTGETKNYVIAIDLNNENSLLWARLIEDRRYHEFEYAGGQYTILMDNNGNNPRIAFNKYLGEVMAVGTNSN